MTRAPHPASGRPLPAAQGEVLLLALLLSACGGGGWAPAPTQVRSRAVDERAEAFFAGPWPDDRRLIDGKLSTRRFPKPGLGSLIDNLLASGDKQARGFGLTSPIYVTFSGPIDEATLPATPQAAREQDASVFLVAVGDVPSAGQRRFLDARFLAAPTLYLPGNVLAVRPAPGAPLEPATTYALVVTTRVKDVTGAAVGGEEALWNVLHGRAQDAYYAPLLATLDAMKVPRGDVAGAFLFTTQPILDELLSLRDWLEAQPSPALDAPRLSATRPASFVFEGTYKAPNLQHGDPPYSLSGGDFRFDGSGAPLPSVVEDMRVAMCVPRGAPPAGGFPVVLYSHGTGGDYRSFVDDICDELTAIGIAAVGIDQVFHGPRGRGGTGCFGQDITICFFNPVNVVSGRNTIRMAALDNVMLRKMLTRAVVPASVHPEGREVRFAAERVAFFGHSQGGLSGAIYSAFAPQLSGAVLSGAGGHLTTTVVERKDPIDVKALAEGPLILGIEGREALDPYHPALALMQALGDVADPHVYGRYWVKRPQGAPKHLYVTSGLDDPYTPAFTAEVMAAAAGLPQHAPAPRGSAPHAMLGLEPVAPPLSANVFSDDGRRATATFRQFAGAGHFPVFDDATARRQWVAFLDGALRAQTVVVPAP